LSFDMAKSRIDADHLARISAGLGEAVLDPAVWPALMEEMCTAVGATGAALLQSDTRTPDIPRTESVDESFKRYFAGEAAKGDAAKANERAVEAQLTLDKFRAPRLPTPDQLDQLVDRIRPFAGTKFDIGHGLDDLEQMDLLWKLEPKLSEAGWVHLNWTGAGNVFVKPNWPGNYVYGRIGANNVSIELHPEHEQELTQAANALVAALNEIGVAANSSTTIVRTMMRFIF
jgi:hypothetical protein